MWDLNADMQTDEARTTTELSQRQRGGAMMDDSGTSTSSLIVNAAGDDDSNGASNTRAYTYTFDIMNNNNTADDDENDVIASSSLLLYSSAAAPSFGGVGMTSTRSSSSATSPKSDWLNLSVPESGEQSEMRISPQTQQTPVKKSRRGPRSRSSQYRGVTFYRRTGRWESHIWDCGKQVYLGGFDTAHAAARAYDRAAIKFRGTDADINFNIADYQEDITQMKNLSKEDFVQILRRQTTGFARGSSKYRGVTLHKCGRWEARMGQLLGKKAYDVAALRCNGSQAATNFEPSTYEGDLASPSHANNSDASGHVLDLSLSLDSSSDYSPKLVDSTSRAVEGQIAVSPHSQRSLSYNYAPMSQGMAIHSESYLPMSHEIQSTERSTSLVSPRMPSWGWQHPQGHGSTITRPPPFSSAASSGFPLFSSTTPSTSLTSVQMQQAHQSYPYQNNNRNH